ncbi:hypothetical protein ABSA28_00891 [Candidatus Hepatincolaceae symbiont of Richtersius coronifer]
MKISSNVFLFLLFIAGVFTLSNLQKKLSINKKLEALNIAIVKDKNIDDNDLEEKELDELFANYDDNRLSFNIYKNIPKIFKTKSPLKSEYFYRIVPYYKKDLCFYASKSLTTYKTANSEPITVNDTKTRSEFDGKSLDINLIPSFEACMNYRLYDNPKLYAIYQIVFHNFIRTNYKEISPSLINKIKIAKRMRVRNYFNIVEDYPTALASTNLLSQREFAKILSDKRNSTAYCNYKTNFIRIVRRVSQAPGTILSNESSGESCEAALTSGNPSTINADYVDYKLIYTFIKSASNDPIRVKAKELKLPY